MKSQKVLWGVVVSIFFVFGLSLQAEIVKIQVKTEGAKLRLKASPQSAVVATLTKGENFDSEKQEGAWYLINRTDQKSGFSISGYINQSDIDIVKKETPAANDKTVPQLSLSPNLGTKQGKAPDELRYNISKKVTYTTVDLPYEYEILGILSQQEDISGFGFKDPLVEALNKAVKNFEKKVIQLNGDAVVGVNIGFTPRTEKDTGKILLYGTVVRFK